VNRFHVHRSPRRDALRCAGWGGGGGGGGGAADRGMIQKSVIFSSSRLTKSDHRFEIPSVPKFYDLRNPRSLKVSR